MASRRRGVMRSATAAERLDEPWRVAKLARAAQRYSVNVWPSEFEQLRDTGKMRFLLPRAGLERRRRV
jgi:hypothetical protein